MAILIPLIATVNHASALTASPKVSQLSRDLVLLDLDKAYDITSYWGPRPEPPAALATRYLRTIEALSALDPAFGNWHFMSEGKGTPLQGLSHADVTRLVEEGVMTADDGTPTPQMGYTMGAGNGSKPARSSVNMSVNAGNRAMVRYFI